MVQTVSDVVGAKAIQRYPNSCNAQRQRRCSDAYSLQEVDMRRDYLEMASVSSFVRRTILKDARLD